MENQRLTSVSCPAKVPLFLSCSARGPARFVAGASQAYVLMQEAGVPLNLRFEKGPYGPYAKNLRHVLSLIEGHLVSGYGDADDKPWRPIELLPGVSQNSSSVIAAHPETQQRFERVARLIHGFETPFGLELLSTVHWVATREGACSIDEVVTETYEWIDRKKIFQSDQLRLAWRVLKEQGWLPTTLILARRSEATSPSRGPQDIP